MNRTQILLLFGGESTEHEVSIASARNVHAAIDSTKYECILGYIDKQGQWWLVQDINEAANGSLASRLVPSLGNGAFTVQPIGETIVPSVILPILHGRNGEDGSVQGLAQLLHIPIVGCGVEASAVGMDKVLSKHIAEMNDIQVAPYVIYRSGSAVPVYTDITRQFGDVIFVKPARSGSSIGVSRVTNENEFKAALIEAEKHDSVVVIEKAIVGRELEVAVLGTSPNHRMSDPGEILADGDFYSFTAKYDAHSQSQTVLQVELDDVRRATLREWSGRIYEAIGCSGLSRVDFLLAHEGELYFNEINTFPGFTNISMYPKLWEAQGVRYSELVDLLIQDALLHATIKPTSNTEG